MLKIEFVFFDWDSAIEFHRETGVFKNWDEAYGFGEDLANQLMTENNLDYIHWNYELKGEWNNEQEE